MNKLSGIFKAVLIGGFLMMNGFQSNALAMGQDILASAMQKNGDYGDYQFIKNMPEFVKQNTPVKEGTKEIQVNKFVVFDAKVMTLPEKQSTDYLNLAISVAKINPLPVVEHTMFVGVSDKMIIPVYVEKSVVAEIQRLYKRYGGEGFRADKLRFAGIHVYNYSKGPAIVVESIAEAKGK
ncbi:hypothetical protein [Thiomicrorhabdus hydrogeniphila]